MLGGANDGYESTDARVASLAKAKKILFEGISMDVFSRIDVSGSAIEI
jgi:hypothetical protein